MSNVFCPSLRRRYTEYHPAGLKKQARRLRDARVGRGVGSRDPGLTLATELDIAQLCEDAWHDPLQRNMISSVLRFVVPCSRSLSFLALPVQSCWLLRRFPSRSGRTGCRTAH